MFSIYADGERLYDDTCPIDQYVVINPNLKMADSSAGSLEMTLPPCNVVYGTLKRMKTTIIVKRFNDEIWEGRLVEDEYDFEKNRKVYCEGALAYLNDTCQPQREYRNVLLNDFIQSVLDIHNAKVPEQRRIYLDYQNVDGGVIDYRVTQYEKTLETLSKVCSDYSCHMKLVKKTENTAGEGEDPVYVTKKYLIFFKGPLNVSSQTVEFGKNLLDYTSNFDMSTLATVVMPLGAVKKRESSSGVGNAIDLTREQAYDSELGYGVVMPLTAYQTINYEDEIRDNTRENPILIPVSGGDGYHVAILRVKASTTDNPVKIFITSRNHGGFGHFVLQTFVDPRKPGGDFTDGKWSSKPKGFTDLVEYSYEMPHSEVAGTTYYVYIASFGYDFLPRVNISAKATDELDEYYTAEDAMVSSVNLVSTSQGVDQMFEQGRFYVTGEDNAGSKKPYDQTSDTKFIRTINQFTRTGGFESGEYTIRVTTTDGKKVVQTKVLWYNDSDNTFIGNVGEWTNVPSRFKLPAGSFKLNVECKYADGTDISPSDVSGIIIQKGERFGSLYVTAQSRNLFDSVLEQGIIIDSGDLIGQPSSSTDVSQIRSASLIGTTTLDGDKVGFDPGKYLLSGTVTQVSSAPDNQRAVEVRVFFYDAETGEYLTAYPFVDWQPLPYLITVPNRGEGVQTKLRFAFRLANSSHVIAITDLTEVMLENVDDDTTLATAVPSMYEPANTSFEEYGWIEAVVNWSDVESPDELYYKAKTYLASGQFDKMTLNVKALDLSTIGVQSDKLEINDYIRVRSAPHGLDKYFEISELNIPLDSPADMEFTLGSETEQTLTSINDNVNQELLNKINSQTSSSYILDSAKKNAANAVIAGFSSGSMITITDDDDNPTGLGFFRVWTDQSHTATRAYSGQIPSARWSDIWRYGDNNNPLRDVMCLYINTEGILFYGNGMSANPTMTLLNGMGQLCADAILAEFMYADRIKGGTLTLGIGGDGNTKPDGNLVVKANVTLPWTGADNDEIIQINKSSGIVQQGIDSGNQTRQVKILNGVVEGSFYENGWHVGGQIYMATYWNLGSELDPNIKYGLHIRSANGPLVIEPGSFYSRDSSGVAIKSTQGSDNWAWGWNQTVVIGDTTLHFTHGWLTDVTSSGGGGGSYVSQQDFDTLVSKYNAFIDGVGNTLVDKNGANVEFMANALRSDYRYPTP